MKQLIEALNHPAEAFAKGNNANWLIMNGNRVQIKRKQFEKMIDSMEVI